jgi:spore germination cell wall hydrolase CwlJ-like protein
MSASLIGAGVGLALGAAYMAAGMSQAVVDHAHASRVAQVASGDFSESVLQREASDPVVARLAMAHDPSSADDAAPDHQLQALTDRLQQREQHPELLQQARDLECLTDAVYYESRGEAVRGQEAVAQVVMNRVKNPRFPKTVCGVVFQRASAGCQFSFACDGAMRHARDRDAWEEARRVAARALSGFVLRDIGSATHYHTVDVSPGWGPKMLRVAQVGLHVFYRRNPHAMDIDPPAVAQTAVFTSAPADAKGQPTLRIAAALVQKVDDKPAAAEKAGKDAKAVVELPKAAPQGLAKAADADAPKPVETASAS